jgi:hypothetical protein
MHTEDLPVCTHTLGLPISDRKLLGDGPASVDQEDWEEQATVPGWQASL